MSAEKIVANRNNLKLWTESIGMTSDIPCLLISGAGAPAKFWSDDFCDVLKRAGFFVIRYDHRDQGLSDSVEWGSHPYTVKDLADDALDILDAYQIKKAHIVGHSMGGIIAQLLAINHPDRLLSFTSMSVSTVGKVSIPPKEIMDILLENKPTQNFSADLPGFMASWRILNGTFPIDEERTRAYTEDFYIRSKHKIGVAWNHIHAQETFTDLSKLLPTCRATGLFIHGELDPLMRVEGAIETAKLMPNAKFIIVPGMGHMFFNKELEQRIARYLIQHFENLSKPSSINKESVKLVDLAKIKKSDYKNQFVGCLVLTKNRQILLQQRGHDFVTYPDYLCEFGGHVEQGEQPMQAVIRELKEELGALAQENEIVSLGAITEAMSGHNELVYVYFWHDAQGTITGCYEGTPRLFDNVESIFAYPKITDGLCWMLHECQRRGLLTK